MATGPPGARGLENQTRRLAAVGLAGPLPGGHGGRGFCEREPREREHWHLEWPHGGHRA